MDTPSGRILLAFVMDGDNYTTVTDSEVEGRWMGIFYREVHGTGNLSYDIIKSDGSVIENKDLINEAVGVKINDRSPFWIPSEAILPFCNLLNFIR